MPMNPDELLARADDWLQSEEAISEDYTEALIRALRAALAAQPQPDERDAEIERLKWMVSEARRLGVVFKLRGAYLKAGSATPTGDETDADVERMWDEATPTEIARRRVTITKGRRWLAGPATPTGDNE